MFAAFSGFYPTIKPALRARARFKIYISRAKTRIENSRRRNFWPTGEKLFERQERILSCAIISIRDRICDLCLARYFSPRFLFVVDLERRGENLSRTIEREREQNLSSRVLRFFRPRLNITDKMWLPVYSDPRSLRSFRTKREFTMHAKYSSVTLCSPFPFVSLRYFAYIYVHTRLRFCYYIRFSPLVYYSFSYEFFKSLRLYARTHA